MDPFIAEVRIFPFDFAPKGWAFCNGQILPLSQNTALFSLLGTTYGGNGQTNFALPNLQGSVPIHPGQGPGLSSYALGDTGGSDSVTLLLSEIPAHDHLVQVSEVDGNSPDPANHMLADADVYVPSTASPMTQLSPQALAPSGGDQPHNNLMPYLTMNFCIALQGVFPPHS
jgi:microcystin-dependent protein